MQPLTRTLACSAVGVAAVFGALEATNAEPTFEATIRAHPSGTRGCPGLRQQLRAWQEELSLRHWQIEAVCGLPLGRPDELLGTAHRVGGGRRARIRIREGLSVLYQQQILVHELVHVGVAAKRWRLPDGQDEEAFVDELGEELFWARRQVMQVILMESAQRQARSRLRLSAPPQPPESPRSADS